MTFTTDEVESIEWVRSLIGEEDIDDYEALEANQELEDIIERI